MSAAGAGPLAIIAGGGSLPAHVADAAVAARRPVLVLGIDGEADPAISAFPHQWIKWGQIGRLFDLLERHGGRDVVMVGTVARRPDFRRIRPDFGAVTSLPEILAILSGGDDSVLSGVIGILERRGYRVVGAHEVARDLVAVPGCLSRRAPGPEAQRDIALAFGAARAIGARDIGQAAVAIGGRVVALEAAEGTDMMLERVGALRAAGRIGGQEPAGVLVKCAKPGQDLRVDMPTIGPHALDNAAAAGLAGIAVEAARVMLADRAETVRRADAAGLFLVAEAVEGEAR